MYLATPSGPLVREQMVAGVIGCLATPSSRDRLPQGCDWAADNGCFGSRYVGDERWLAWLERMAPEVERCLFATAPDVVGDARATLARSVPFLPQIRSLGYPAALVAQDGLEDEVVPWAAFDALFLGGSTDWKLGPAAADLAAQARARGKWVHMGRVNSRKRFRYAAPFCDSADGTFLAFGPTRNLPQLLSWIEATP